MINLIEVVSTNSVLEFELMELILALYYFALVTVVAFPLVKHNDQELIVVFF